MRTPSGRLCDYYYEDFHRGRNVQECRIPKGERSVPWQPEYCTKCPIPDILRANASPNLELTLTIRSIWLGFGRKMLVEAWCRKHDIPISDPYVGCKICNDERPGLALFAQALEDPEDNDD
ncbi:MAG: hypothetical protein CUN55_10285 [Phototrophicales bacterium]|nr:MAG: hypothetical protein CUN55_10285 [Phototrophicales bacterium]